LYDELGFLKGGICFGGGGVGGGGVVAGSVVEFLSEEGLLGMEEFLTDLLLELVSEFLVRVNWWCENILAAVVACCLLVSRVCWRRARKGCPPLLSWARLALVGAFL